MSEPDIPLRFLLDSSKNILGDFELTKLNHADLIRKQMRTMLDRLVDEMTAAQFARWLVEHKEELLTSASSIPVNLHEDAFDLRGDANR